MAFLSSWFFLIIPSLILWHLYLAPYTKVEESFNIQAIHDIIKYGIPTTNSALQFRALFDHMTFSGSVPRTFVGAIIIAGISKPIIWLRGLDGLAMQTTVRAILGLTNALAMTGFIKSIRHAYGNRIAWWYTFFQASQFHIFFYASRTLPNMFAFCLSTFAAASFLPDPTAPPSHHVRRLRRAFYLLTFAAVIFRSELVLLIVSHTGLEIFKSGSARNAFALVSRIILPSVCLAGISSVIISMSIDTYFWQSSRPLLPELAAFWFNIFPKDHQGASAWGTSPWHWYFTSALPRLLPGIPLFLIPYGVLSTQWYSVLDASLPPLLYTTMYSVLAHKETRFLFPIVPQLTLATAISASFLSLRREQWAKAVTMFTVFSTIILGFLSHAILLPLSAQNYPGGVALETLHTYYYNNPALDVDSQPDNSVSRPQIHVHLTNLALQSGVTRFLEQSLPVNIATESLETHSYRIPSQRSLWLYDKTQTSNTTHPSFYSQFDFLIVETQAEPPKNTSSIHWIPVASVSTLRRSRPRILRPMDSRGCLFLPCKREAEIQMSTRSTDEDSLYILFRAMYGERVAQGYSIIHDLFREGYGTGKSVTRGYWMDWGLEERLVVLKRDRVYANVE